MNAVSTLIFRGKDRVSGGASISQVIRIAPLAEPKSHRTKNFISGNHPLENEARFEHPQKASGVVEKEQRSIIRENFYDRKSKRGENFDSLYPGERQIDSSSFLLQVCFNLRRNHWLCRKEICVRPSLLRDEWKIRNIMGNWFSFMGKTSQRNCRNWQRQLINFKKTIRVSFPLWG